MIAVAVFFSYLLNGFAMVFTAAVVVWAVVEYRKLDREPSNVGLLEHRLYLAVMFVAGLLGSRAALVVPAAMLFCGIRWPREGRQVAGGAVAAFCGVAAVFVPSLFLIPRDNSAESTLGRIFLIGALIGSAVVIAVAAAVVKSVRRRTDAIAAAQSFARPAPPADEDADGSAAQGGHAATGDREEPGNGGEPDVPQEPTGR